MSPVDFDLLVQRAYAPSATVADKDQLWGAAFALTEWHFIARGPLPNPHPYVASNTTVANGASMVKAFTDSERLDRFARENQLAGADGAVQLLSMPTHAALRYLASLGAGDVYGLHFNADRASFGFFIPLAQLPIVKRHLDASALR